MKIPEMIGNICAKCVEINGIEGHTHADSNRPNVFFNYSGHVGQLSIRYHTNGWASHADDETLACGDNFYTYRLTGKEYLTIMDELDALKNHFNEIALDCDIENLDNLKKLGEGEVFLLTLPTNRVVRGVTVMIDGKTRYDVDIAKSVKAPLSFRQLKTQVERLREIMRGNL